MIQDIFSGNTIVGYFFNDRTCCNDCVGKNEQHEDELSEKLQSDDADTLWNTEGNASEYCDFCQLNLINKMFHVCNLLNLCLAHRD